MRSELLKSGKVRGLGVLTGLALVAGGIAFHHSSEKPSQTTHVPSVPFETLLSWQGIKKYTGSVVQTYAYLSQERLFVPQPPARTIFPGVSQYDYSVYGTMYETADVPLPDPGGSGGLAMKQNKEATEYFWQQFSPAFDTQGFYHVTGFMNCPVNIPVCELDDVRLSK